MGLICTLVPIYANCPTWWATRDVRNEHPADDYAIVNIGQLKHVATQAAAELNQRLPGGAGTAISNLVDNWHQPPESGVIRDDYAALNIGQLKNVTKLFYDRLAQIGYAGPPLVAGQTYPWGGATTASDNYALANLGQVKNLFSFDLSAPEGQLSGWWQTLYFGNLNVDPDADPDGDGFSNLDEYLASTIPTNYYSRPGGSLNLPPTVTVAGEHTLVWPENEMTLEALASDADNWPQALSYAWSKASGPGPVTFAHPDQPQTIAQFSQTGAYLLKIEASDGEASAAAIVAVNILPAAATAPTVLFTAPADGSQLNQGEEFVLWVKADDSYSGIDIVTLYRNGVLLESKLGEDITSYLFNWTEPALGAVTFTAVATNSLGISASASISLSFFPATVGPPPGGPPPGSPGSGNQPSGPGANVPGSLQQLVLPTGGPLGFPEQFSVTTSDMEEISDEHEYTGEPGQFVLLEVVVYSEEYPEWTGQESEFDDAASWTIQPTWGQSQSGSHRVNALHDRFNADKEAIVGYFGIRFPSDEDPTNRRVEFRATVQNIADGSYDTGVQFRLVPVEVKEVEFHGNQTVKKDDGSGDYEGVDWRDVSNPSDGDAEDQGDQKWPVCYIKGDTIGVTAKLKCPGPNGMSVRVRAKAKGSKLKSVAEDELIIGPSSSITISNGEINVPLIEGASPINGSMVNYIENMQMTWELSVDGGANWHEVGKSKHPFYALYGQPIQAEKLYHTVLHLACSKPGAATWNQVVENVWANFSGPGNVKAWNASSRAFDVSLQYYRENIIQQNAATTTEGLLTEQNGQCFAWMKLFLDCLKIHGEPTSRAIQVNAGADDGDFILIIKNWILAEGSPQPSRINFPTDFPDTSCSNGNAQYGNWISDTGILGQNTGTPYVKVFGGHAIAQYGSTYYDPSYGVTYVSEQDFENKSIDGYGVLDVVSPAVIIVHPPSFTSPIFGPVSYP